MACFVKNKARNAKYKRDRERKRERTKMNFI